MSYTADPGVLFAAERKLLAWSRSAIALVGFGFVVERLGLFLQMVAHQPVSGPSEASRVDWAWWSWVQRPLSSQRGNFVK